MNITIILSETHLVTRNKRIYVAFEKVTLFMFYQRDIVNLYCQTVSMKYIKEMYLAWAVYNILAMFN